MSDDNNQTTIFQLADQFIALANELTQQEGDVGKVGTALRFAAARFNAFEAAIKSADLAPKKPMLLSGLLPNIATCWMTTWKITLPTLQWSTAKKLPNRQAMPCSNSRSEFPDNCGGLCPRTITPFRLSPSRSRQRITVSAFPFSRDTFKIYLNICRLQA